MSKHALTDILIKSLAAPQSGQTEVWDAKIPGFGVRISPSGTKAFVVLYRHKGRPRRLSLGRYPALSLAEARRRAHEAIATVAGGDDPSQERGPRRKADTAAETIESFIRLHCARFNKPSTAKEVARLLRTNFLPAWGSRGVADLTKRDVLAVLDRMVARGSGGAANHALAAIRKFFNWCVERGIIDGNPCLGLRNPAKHGKRDRVLSDAELAAIWRAAEEDGYPVSHIVRLLILTAQRRGEIAGMRWQDIDLEAPLWSLPAELTKANRAHAVPMCGLVPSLIRSVPRISDTLLFPARGLPDQRYDGFGKAKMRIDARCGFSDWTLHDLRRTAATGMARLGVGPHVIERILNHTTGTFGGVAGIYNRFQYVPEMRAALELWAAHVGSVTKTEN